MLHHWPFRAAKLRQDLLAQFGVRSAAAFLNRGNDGALADVVRAAMIARGWAVASGALNFALRIASESRRARSHYEDDRRPFTRSRQRRFQIGQDGYRRARKAFLQCAAHPLFHVGLGGTGQARANRRDRAALESGFSQRQFCAFLDRARCAFHSDARGVRRPCICSRQDLVGRVH